MNALYLKEKKIISKNSGAIIVKSNQISIDTLQDIKSIKKFL